ncbi:MAG: sialate O-acetylesterase [Bacteroidales bacterium 45-6]|nr:MAG: sialate O-acetylesterase [Bacteroidales bacterium 45-6]
MKRIELLCLTLLTVMNLSAKIKLPSVLGDNMVLQRSASVNLWGWATPHRYVKVKPSWGKQTYKVKSGSGGNWIVRISTPEAGGPYSIEISDGEPLTIKDILIGEVWICSGQSNMEMPMHGFYGQPVEGTLEDIADAAQYPGIRMFTVSPSPKADIQEDCMGGWKKSDSGSVRDFSAVAYLFGKNLNKILGIPIGLITSNCGGTPIEAWMTVDAIKQTAGINHERSLTHINDWESTTPSYLYNGMIAPLIQYTSRGFIWYQGETNQNNSADYDKLMASMVKLWREKWENMDMPFYYVQLAPFTFDGANSIRLPLTIEAQYKALRLIPNSAIASTTDLGHPTAIHPPRKKEIGLRLASIALRNTYKTEAPLADAPVIDNVRYEGNKAILTFKNVPGYSPAAVGSFNYYVGELKGFELAGQDRKFYRAKANHVTNQNKIEVTCEQVPNPVSVRYAFRNFSDANVMTTEGLPLAPFRTDNWDDSF